MNAAARSWPRLERALEDEIRGSGRGRWRRLVDWRSPRRRTPFAPGVYVFTFHAVIDPDRATSWERAYDKVAVSADAFRATLRFLSAHFDPLRLSEALALEGRSVDRPCAVVTFDDGYANTVTAAAPIAAECGYHPALFVNGAFAEGRVYYRVLVALLTNAGQTNVLREELMARVPSIAWSSDPTALFDQTKDAYVRGAIEEASDAAFRRVFGDPASLGVHVTVDQVRMLKDLGWEIANHTFAHDVLNDLDANAVRETCERNEHYWAARGISLLPCVAYPNGAAKHVGAGVLEYLQERPELHGMFCAGGFNQPGRRMEWLRMPVSPRFASALPQAIDEEIARTHAAAQVVQRAAS